MSMVESKVESTKFTRETPLRIFCAFVGGTAAVTAALLLAGRPGPAAVTAVLCAQACFAVAVARWGGAVEVVSVRDSYVPSWVTTTMRFRRLFGWSEAVNPRLKFVPHGATNCGRPRYRLVAATAAGKVATPVVVTGESPVEALRSEFGPELIAALRQHGLRDPRAKQPVGLAANFALEA